MTLLALIRSPASILVGEIIVLASLMFATFSVLVRVTDMETVGLWVLLNALLGFSRVADFWSRGLASFVGEARGKGNIDEAATFVSTAVLSGVAGYAVLGALGVTLIWTFASSLAGAEHADLARNTVPLMGCTFWLLALSGIYQGSFLAFGRPAWKAAQSIGGAVVFLVLTLVLAPRYGLWGILVAQSLQGVAMAIYSVIAFHCVLVRGHGSLWQWDQFVRLVTYGSKATAVGTLQLAIDPVVRVLASQFGGLASVTAIELASRLIGVVRSLITAIGQILVPEFARLGATGGSQLTALYQEANKLFLLASLSAFSVLISSAPGAEEIMLGQTETGFVILLWILSAGWFVNTITAPAYFLLFSQRRLRPLFWVHLIMTGGAIVLGIAGGLLNGVNGMVVGVALALVLSSVYLIWATDHLLIGPAGHHTNFKLQPKNLLPVFVAIGATVLLQTSELLDGSTLLRYCSYAAAIGGTLIACVFFGNIRSVVSIAVRMR